MWLPISEFFVWLVIIDVLARKAVKRQEHLSVLEGLNRGDRFGVYPPSRAAALAHAMALNDGRAQQILPGEVRGSGATQ